MMPQFTPSSPVWKIVLVCLVVALFLVVITFLVSYHAFYHSNRRNPVNNHRFFQKERHGNTSNAVVSGSGSLDTSLNVPVFVVNMDKDVGRWKTFQKDWKELIPQKERFPAVRGKWRHSQIGCTTSHIRCVLDFFAKNPGKDMVVVMEDDAVPFRGLRASDLAEYLHILEKNTDKFDMANMSPVIDEKTFDGSGRSVPTSFAPEHFLQCLNMSSVCTTHFMAYARSMVPIFEKILEDFVSEEKQIPIVIDRIAQPSHGPYKIPFLRTVIPDVCFAYQSDGFSNNENAVTFLGSDAMLKRMHKNSGALWKSRHDPLNPSLARFLRREIHESNPFAGITVVMAFFPISSKMPSENYLRFGKTLLENLTGPLVVLTVPHLKEKLESYRPKGWPLKVLAFSSVDEISPVKDMVSAKDLETCAQKASRASKHNFTPELLKVWLSKPFFMQKVLDMVDIPKTPYYMYLDFGSFRRDKIKGVHSGTRIFKNVSKLRFFPSYSKVDMVFHEKDGNDVELVFPKCHDYEGSLESDDCFNKWGTLGGFIFGTEKGFRNLANSFYTDFPVLLASKKYPYLCVDECYWELLRRKYPDKIKRVSNESTSDKWFGFYDMFQDLFLANPTID